MTIMLDRDTERRRLVTGGDPAAIYPVPTVTRDYAEAEELAEIADLLIAAHPERFGHLAGMYVVYRWKREGGESGGRPACGRCVKPTGLTRHFGGCDFAIWLAADWCRALDFTRWEVEWQVFHQRCHAARNAKGRPTLAPHDAEIFVAEIEHYGLPSRDLERVGTAVAGRQLPLVAANGAGS